MFYPLSKRSRIVFASWLCVLTFFLMVGVQTISACGGNKDACKSTSTAKACPMHSEAIPTTGKQATSNVIQTPKLEDFAKEKLYTCPMHPEVREKKSGKCPKCGMSLAQEDFYKVYTCPKKECPKISAKADKCCGKDLKMTLMSKKEYNDFTQEQEYICPMHSDVVSNQPGKCPKCGMNLEKRAVSKAEEEQKEKPEEK